MADWIHCNKCYVRFTSPTNNVQLYLTECGHIFCQKCVSNIREKKCLLCARPTGVIPLNKNLDPTMMAYFNPLENSLSKCVEIFRYQQLHKDRLFQALFKKYQFAKKECMNQMKRCKKLADENRALKAMIQASGGNPQLATSTPVSMCSMSNLDRQNFDSSLISSIAPSASSAMRRPPPPPNFANRLAPQQHLFQTPSPVQQVPMAMARVHPSVGSGQRAGGINPMYSFGQLRRKLQ